MIFLTVGTQFPFDRLVKSIDEMVGRQKLSEEIFAQIGDSSYIPKNFESAKSLQKRDFDKYICEASSIISHAGMGIITSAMDNRKPQLVMPRLAEYGEVVNDHQVAIAKIFERLKHILVAYKTGQLQGKIGILRDFVPVERQVKIEGVINRVSAFIGRLNGFE